jgi:putative PIN family toxin of toxin-antitoxin system
MRIVLDTNVLLAGLATRGICEAVVDQCLTSVAHTLVLSPYILDEFHKHFTGKFGVPPEKSRATLEMLRNHAEIVEPAAVSADACRDPDDLPVLGTLIAANADCLVTGDADLLSLKQYEGRPILSPRQLYEQLRTQL